MLREKLGEARAALIAERSSGLHTECYGQRLVQRILKGPPLAARIDEVLTEIIMLEGEGARQVGNWPRRVRQWVWVLRGGSGGLEATLLDLGAVALAGLAAVLFIGTLAAVGADAIAGGASTAGAASAAAGAARNATPRCCSTCLLVEAGCTGVLGVGLSPEVNASSSSAQASRNPAMDAQGHRLQVGVSFANRAAQKMQELKRDPHGETSLAASERSPHSRTGSVSSSRVEDGTGGDRARPRREEAYMRRPKQNITNKGDGRLPVAESAAAPSYRRRGVTIASA